MNTRAKACRAICPDKTRKERVECRIKGPCEAWRNEHRRIENATKPAKEQG